MPELTPAPVSRDEAVRAAKAFKADWIKGWDDFMTKHPSFGLLMDITAESAWERHGGSQANEIIMARYILELASQFPAGGGAGDAWRPIETAPKDGTAIDVITQYGERLTDVYWSLYCWHRQCEALPDLSPIKWQPIGDTLTSFDH